MKKIGLTGGIASGKSTVASLLKKSGAFHLDADQIYHSLLDSNQVLHNNLVTHFGPTIVSDGNINRAALSHLVLADPEKLKQLNTITHPIILSAIEQQLTQTKADICIIEAALLIESNFHTKLDGVIVVTSQYQSDRLINERGMDKQQAAQRIKAQTSHDFKIQHANWIIHNDNDIAQLTRDCRTLWHLLNAPGIPHQYVINNNEKPA